jgi:hypothetical protein
MAGRPHKPSFTILERAHFLENDKVKPIDRLDRYWMDNWTIETLWVHDPLRQHIEQTAKDIQTELQIPTFLKPSVDIRERGAVFVPKRLYVGVNSSYLAEYPNIAKKLEKAVYRKFLFKLNLSYNFYPFFEYLVLYQNRPLDSIIPNPRVLDLIIKRPSELSRTTYTKSDRDYIQQQARILLGATQKRSNPMQAYLTNLVTGMFKEFKSLERPPRDPVIKILCFRIFNDMSTNMEDYLMEDESQRNQFLKVKTPDLVDAYEEFFAQEIKIHFREPLTEQKAYLALRRNYAEYKRNCEIMF